MRVVFRMFCGIIFASTLSTLANAPAFAVSPTSPQSGAYVDMPVDHGYGNVSGHDQSPMRSLQRASEIAGNGDLRKAFSVASKAYTTAQQDPTFVIRYIETMMEMAQQDGTATDKDILNAAIAASSKLYKSQICSGQGDAEMAYHFMNALGALGDATLTRGKRTAAQLYAAQGKIANNLRHNPGYPSQSVNVLGTPLMNSAKAHAINNDEVSAFEMMEDAFEIGFADFDAVLMDSTFAELDQTQLKKTVKSHRTAYRRKLVLWSRDEIARFPTFQINFDVANVDGGRIKSSELTGKVAVVDLWATWCAPCREGIPHFVELDRQYRSKNVAVVGISMDEPTDPASAVDTVKNFGMDNGIDYQLAVGTDAVKSQIPGRVLLPTTLFIDGNGNVRYIASGYHDFMQLEAITNTLLAESNGAVNRTASR